MDGNVFSPLSAAGRLCMSKEGREMFHSHDTKGKKDITEYQLRIENPSPGISHREAFAKNKDN